VDCWHPIAVRAEKADAARQWAYLEGKSPTMREELVQRFAERKSARRTRLANGAICCELIAVALKAWWYLYGN
jgi:hypothetical protein